MKKITLLVCALAVSALTFATPRVSKAAEAKDARMAKVTAVETAIAQPQTFKTVEDREAAKLDTMFMPYYIPGTFHYGSNKNGVFYYANAYHITPFAESLTYLNMYNMASSWKINGEEVAKATSYEFPLSDGFGLYKDAPSMKTPNYAGEESVYFFPEYRYGAKGIGQLQAKYPSEDLSDMIGVEVASAFIQPLTYCAIYSENEGAWYFPFDYGTYRAANGGEYWYGTKLVNKNLSTDEVTAYYDTIAVMVSNPDVMYIEHISLGVYTRQSAGVSTLFPGEDDHVRLTLYPVTDNVVDWESPIASTTANQDDVVGTSWTGFVNFYFYEEDEVTGNLEKTSLIVEGDFIAVLDEFNDGTAEFGILSDDEMTDYSHTYFFYTKEGQLKVSQVYGTPANLLINFHAVLPALNAPKTIQFDLEGGEKEIEITTNVWDEDMVIDADDWIDVEVVTDYETTEEEGQTYYDFKYTGRIKVTIDESVTEPRQGTIEIDALGLPVVIKVNQGEVPSGVENVSFKNDGKLYNVLGVEVGEDYKGVVIRNGQKFVR